MANYNLVIGSRFKPFSYAEMLQPVQMATTAHQAIEDEYSELATKSNVWEGIANEQTDPYAYKMYKNYANDLESQAEVLAREGLTPGNKQNMLKMKQRYSSDIVPIEQAYTRRRELADEQRKLLAQDNTLLFDKAASTMSLDELINNPELAYQSYSGAKLAQQVGTAAQNLSKEMRDNPRKWQKILGNQYYESIMQKGYRPEEIIQVLQNNPNASPILKGIVEDAVGSSNVANWGDNSTLNRAYDYARQGLWNAVGETQYQIQTNKAYDYAMQEALINKRKEGKDGNTGTQGNLYYRAVPKTTVKGDVDTKQKESDLKLIQEIIKDPSLVTKEQRRKVRDPKMFSPDPMISMAMDTGMGEEREETYNPYQEKLKEISKKYNINYSIQDGKVVGGNLEDVANKIASDIRSSAVRSFSYKPNITQSDLITQVLKENTRSFYRRSNNTGLYEIDKGKKGDQVDIDDLNSYFTSDNDIDFDPDLGFIINATDSKGKTRSAVIDTELIDDPNRTFSKTQQSINAALQNGEDELATLLIEATMEAFYKRYNTLEKRQSNTFSKE